MRFYSSRGDSTSRLQQVRYTLHSPLRGGKRPVGACNRRLAGPAHPSDTAGLVINENVFHKLVSIAVFTKCSIR